MNNNQNESTKSKPESKPEKPNPNYPSRTGKDSGKGRGNEPKKK